ncbi:3-isopropylmalate dehydratase small subunit 2 [Desulfogranum marinum]|jgi:3-isopropylmalate/(R)-2-methylmalate dehydratase small subunit|uniref:3-isopropylmalate dehydratase small subunit n=1 Tax=Desulfogranum marinum TaxID=453220 RepID=UPI001964D033|nr:3-isopropylmalate dehydratase small subunit [Desulfogranum marinum]MBM9510788.1 3-isopropylmalate dehydratase small subunit [Desulfogranum marinum]
MKRFGGQAAFINRDDINTDEIIPAKYLTEITKTALKPHLLEDLHLEGQIFDPHADEIQKANVLVTGSNFGCGSSREHAVWALEVNDINLVIGKSFARIFRQNMFNCGILAIELQQADLDALFAMPGIITISVDLEQETITAVSDAPETETRTCSFTLNSFDKQLVAAGGWLNFADQNY